MSRKSRIKNNVIKKFSLVAMIRILLTRTAVWFVVFCGVLILFVDYGHIEQGYQARVLNMVRPSFSDLYYFLENKKSADNKTLMKYAKYYTKVAEFIPENAETQGMLGLNFYYMKGYKQAFEVFEKASLLNKNFFWSRYNSGVILFKTKKYKEAFERFKKALELPAAYNFQLMKNSKVYLQLVGHVKDQDSYFKESLSSGYHDAFVGAVLSAFNLNDLENVLVYSKIAQSKSIPHREAFVFLSGYAAFRLKNFAEAEVHLRESLKLRPQNTAAKKMLATILKANGQGDESEKLLQGISEDDLKAPNKIELGSFDVRMF